MPEPDWTVDVVAVDPPAAPAIVVVEVLYTTSTDSVPVLAEVGRMAGLASVTVDRTVVNAVSSGTQTASKAHARSVGQQPPPTEAGQAL